MSPFDLTGPQFLVFYSIFGFAVLAAVVFIQRQTESPDDYQKLDPSDPYLIAYLRGGKNEALRVATVALIDRGLLRVERTKGGRGRDSIVVGGERVAETVRRPIERALVSHFAVEHDPKSIFDAHHLEEAAQSYEARLRDLRLLPDEAMLSARRGRALAAAALLVAVGAVKIAVAVEQGRTNIAFLVGLMVLGVFLAFRLTNHRRTPVGDAVLADLRTLFKGLRDRANVIRPGGETNELALLSGVYGLGVLGAEYAYAHSLYPRPASSGNGGAGTSCGSLGGNGGGSSCGGGGDGGGCGGCGGG